jgi:hypothetical protein
MLYYKKRIIRGYLCCNQWKEKKQINGELMPSAINNIKEFTKFCANALIHSTHKDCCIQIIKSLMAKIDYICSLPRHKRFRKIKQLREKRKVRVQ